MGTSRTGVPNAPAAHGWLRTGASPWPERQQRVSGAQVSQASSPRAAAPQRGTPASTPPHAGRAQEPQAPGPRGLGTAAAGARALRARPGLPGGGSGTHLGVGASSVAAHLAPGSTTERVWAVCSTPAGSCSLVTAAARNCYVTRGRPRGRVHRSFARSCGPRAAPRAANARPGLAMPRTRVQAPCAVKEDTLRSAQSLGSAE